MSTHVIQTCLDETHTRITDKWRNILVSEESPAYRAVCGAAGEEMDALRIGYRKLVTVQEPALKPDKEVQTQSSEYGNRFFETIKEAFQHADRDDYTVWKVSWTDPDTQERVRFVRTAEGGWRYETMEMAVPRVSRRLYDSLMPTATETLQTVQQIGEGILDRARKKVEDSIANKDIRTGDPELDKLLDEEEAIVIANHQRWLQVEDEARQNRQLEEIDRTFALYDNPEEAARRQASMERHPSVVLKSAEEENDGVQRMMFLYGDVLGTIDSVTQTDTGIETTMILNPQGVAFVKEMQRIEDEALRRNDR